MSIVLQVKVKALEGEVALLKAQFAMLQKQFTELNERIVPAVVKRRTRETEETI